MFIFQYVQTQTHPRFNLCLNAFITFRHEEGPGERGDENTVVRLEENLGRQVSPFGLCKYQQAKIKEQSIMLH